MHESDNLHFMKTFYNMGSIKLNFVVRGLRSSWRDGETGVKVMHSVIGPFFRMSFVKHQNNWHDRVLQGAWCDGVVQPIFWA